MDHTFFNFAFSVCSSLFAFAACRLSCFAVNYTSSLASKRIYASKALTHFQVKQCLLKARHIGLYNLHASGKKSMNLGISVIAGGGCPAKPSLPRGVGTNVMRDIHMALALSSRSSFSGTTCCNRGVLREHNLIVNSSCDAILHSKARKRLPPSDCPSHMHPVLHIILL